jgi:hydroxymethylpyrimidine pyrophosphatase-like HAD family hydrolase
MGGAQPKVKEEADIVLPGNNDDGVAHLIEHFVLGDRGAS